ncbi:MAG: ribosome silencing factor [Oscillospiraceae bacterium]|nr:ribosome silencing factor [Oscillospiraceae bacterium]
MDTINIVETIVKALDAKRAEDINVLHVTDLTILADYFVIADGTSVTQTKALADEVEYQVSVNCEGRKPNSVQGEPNGGWVILDYGDIVVHVFYKEQRDFYNLDKLWADGESVDISSWIIKEN